MESHKEEPTPAHIADTVPHTTVLPETQAPAIDRRWISELIAQKAADLEEYGRQLWTILDCDTIAISIKRDAIYDYNGSYGLVFSDIMFSAVKHFSDFSELDVQYAVRKHPGWIRLEKDEEEMQTKLREWNTKVSQPPSGHPASPPDTTPNASLPSPHQ